MTDRPVELRIGDRERRAVDARLQAAVGDGELTLAEYDERAARLWEARTTADLVALTEDLPGAPVVPAPAAALPATTGTPLKPRRSLAVMSGDALRGPYRPGQPLESYAVMGGATVDLRRDDLPRELHLRAVAVMGGIEVLVPRGATVHLSGVAVMGGRDCYVDPPVAGGPVVHVDAWAVMGGVEVKHDEAVHRESRCPRSVTSATRRPVDDAAGRRLLRPARRRRRARRRRAASSSPGRTAPRSSAAGP